MEARRLKFRMLRDLGVRKAADFAALPFGSDNLWTVDSGLTTVSIGDNVLKELAVEGADRPKTSLLDALPAEDLTHIKRAIQAMAKGSTRYEFNVKRPDGGSFYANLPTAVEDHEGVLGAIFLIDGDRPIAWLEIEKKGASEERLPRSQERAVRIQYEKELLDMIMESTVAQIVYLDRDFKFLKVNRAFERASGLSQSQILGKRFFDAMPDEEIEKTFRRVRETGVGWELKAKPFNVPGHPERGTLYRDWSLMTVRDQKGRVQGLVLSLNDVTERVTQEKEIKRMAEESESERRRLRAILDTLPVGVMVADPSGAIIERNAILEDIWRSSSEGRKLDFRSFRAWFSDTGIPLKPEDWGIAVAMRHGKREVGQVLDIMRFDGSRGTVLYSAAPVKDEKGKVVGGVAIVQDITNQRQLEHEALESKAKAELYLGLMSRDLGGLHLDIMSNLKKIADRPKLDPRVKKVLVQSMEGLTECSRLIEVVDKIELMEGHSLKYGIVDVGLLLSDLVDRIVKDYDVEIDLHTSPWVTVNGSNLLGDALEYIIEDAINRSPGKLQMNITIGEAFEAGKQFHKIVFEDDIGEAPKSTSFFSLPLGGKTMNALEDLRLYLVRMIIEDHHGRIWLTSRVQGDWSKGRRIAVLLPAAVVRQEVLPIGGPSEDEED
ncbi:MAG TPA: PAS domain S-box protein [Methanomassiliicoccales archaeon]|nr:PAS domain S-box protein [Methanomassiliicoccales archaeon]